MTEKRPAGVTLFGFLFVLWGLRAMILVSPGHGNFDRILGTSLAFLSFATAYGLFQMRFWSLTVYAVWIGVVIAAGSVIEYQCNTSVKVIVVAMSLYFAAYVAVGLYLRSSLAKSD